MATMADLQSEIRNYNFIHVDKSHFVTTCTSCDICMEDESDPEMTKLDIVKIEACGHTFHHTCLTTWLKTQIEEKRDGTCPMCRHILIPLPKELAEAIPLFYQTVLMVESTWGPVSSPNEEDEFVVVAIEEEIEEPLRGIDAMQSIMAQMADLILRTEGILSTE